MQEPLNLITKLEFIIFKLNDSLNLLKHHLYFFSEIVLTAWILFNLKESKAVFFCSIDYSRLPRIDQLIQKLAVSIKYKLTNSLKVGGFNIDYI